MRWEEVIHVAVFIGGSTRQLEKWMKNGVNWYIDAEKIKVFVVSSIKHI